MHVSYQLSSKIQTGGFGFNTAPTRRMGRPPDGVWRHHSKIWAMEGNANDGGFNHVQVTRMA